MTCVKQIGNGLEGSRGGRVVWTCSDQLLTVTGFDRLIVRCSSCPIGIDLIVEATLFCF